METFTVFSDALISAFCAREPYDPVNPMRPHSGHALRQQNLRAGIFDRDVPFVAGYVPVEFVMVLEKSQAVANLVMQVMVRTASVASST